MASYVEVILSTHENWFTPGSRWGAIFPRHMLVFTRIADTSSIWHLARYLSSWAHTAAPDNLGATNTIAWGGGWSCERDRINTADIIIKNCGKDINLGVKAMRGRNIQKNQCAALVQLLLCSPWQSVPSWQVSCQRSRQQFWERSGSLWTSGDDQ